MAEDLGGTLARVAAMGYQEVEFAGYFGRTSKEIRRILDDLDLQAPSAHVSANELIEHSGPVLDSATEAGHVFLVIAYWEPHQRTAAGYHRLLKLLEKVGPMAKERGLKIAYHNHDFEFELEAHSGDTHYERLLSSTDPECVFFEMDIYWVAKRLVSPVELLKQHPGRFPLLHIKDRDDYGEETDVGRGNIGIPSILQAAINQGVEHCFIERDNPSDPLSSAQWGLDWLNQNLPCPNSRT